MSKCTIESAEQFIKAFTHPGGDYPEFHFIGPIRWYQFWRIRELFNRDYLLSRVAEIILQERTTAFMQKELDAVRPLSDPKAEVSFLSRKEDSDV